MGRRFILVALVVLLGSFALSAGPAAATPGKDTAALATLSALSTAVDPLQEEIEIDLLVGSGSSSTKHIGPVPSSSPDSGTCGNDWAQDTFNRYFTIRQTGPGTYTVYEQFKNGTFVTVSGLSPGACDLSDGYGPGIVSGGLTGTMHGYLIAGVTCADPAVPCTNPTASCSAIGDPCQTTFGFLGEFFPGATRIDIDTYFFHYAGYDGTNKALIVHEWKNASCNRGGNHGDIATATTTVPFEIATC